MTRQKHARVVRGTSLAERIAIGADWLAHASRCVFFTGAGISTDSGLPDFRGPDGVWTRRDKGLPPKPSKVPWHMVAPNAGHMALVELESRGKLQFLISQNVDNLHLKSGIPSDKIAELHGNTTLMKCMECDARYSKDALGWDERKWGKSYRTSPVVPGQPVCPACEGRLISSVVNFGDPMPEAEMELASWHATHCDLFVVLGSSIQVSPASDFPVDALQTGAKLIIINKGETPLDDHAHLRFFEGIAETLLPMVDLMTARG